MIHDRGPNFTAAFDAVLADAGIRTVLCNIQTPRMNAIAERWIGGCRRELLDRTLIWNLLHLRRILRQYETHHNQHRPHRSLHGAAPLKPLPNPVDLDRHRVTLGTIPLLPSVDRIYGYVGFACVLIVTLICMVVVAKSTSQDHTQPNLGVMVKKLTNKLIEARFLPQLIIAIPRGGLAVAGLLAKELGEEEIVPVISLSPSKGSGFDNSFNNVRFGRRDFDSSTADPIRILIVDDICRSGRTLDDARACMERFIDQGDFVIRTAAISFYRSHNRATSPSFFVDRPTEAIRDASGDVEAMY